MYFSIVVYHIVNIFFNELLRHLFEPGEGERGKKKLFFLHIFYDDVLIEWILFYVISVPNTTKNNIFNENY